MIFSILELVKLLILKLGGGARLGLTMSQGATRRKSLGTTALTYTMSMESVVLPWQARPKKNLTAFPLALRLFLMPPSHLMKPIESNNYNVYLESVVLPFTFDKLDLNKNWTAFSLALRPFLCPPSHFPNKLLRTILVLVLLLLMTYC